MKNKTNRLRFYMNRRGVSLSILSKATGIAKATLNHYEQDNYEPPISKMRQIASVLICGVSDIWPAVKEPVDWEFRHQLLTERIEKLDYRKDAEEYRQLCNERNWVSIKIIQSERRTLLHTRSYNDYDCTPLPASTYGKIPSTGKVITL